MALDEWRRENEFVDCPNNAVTHKKWALRRNEREKDQGEHLKITPYTPLIQSDTHLYVQSEDVKTSTQRIMFKT